jgi:sugar (pentulose or hexulose) kinase
LGLALPYHQACPAVAGSAAAIAGSGPAAGASGSLARALTLLQGAADQREIGPWLLRHQADWLMGWLLGDWRWGEEANNLRLGWDLERQTWSGSIGRQSWAGSLPTIQPSGRRLGCLSPEAAAELDLPDTCQVVSGSTDANAGVLAADPAQGDGVAVLGTTLVLKRFVVAPLQGPGISCHRVAGRWLVGGASNAGAGILRRFFTDGQIAALSRQIDPEHPTGLQLRPLPAKGERFPVDDPELEPVLEPRPVSDALYLQALLEGLTALEVAGWQRLRELGMAPLRQVISLGGGARNPQWRRMRERALGVPVLNRPRLSAARGMAQLALTALEGAGEEAEAGGRARG